MRKIAVKADNEFMANIPNIVTNKKEKLYILLTVDDDVSQ
jgi:hypothetical protein